MGLPLGRNLPCAPPKRTSPYLWAYIVNAAETRPLLGTPTLLCLFAKIDNRWIEDRFSGVLQLSKK